MADSQHFELAKDLVRRAQNAGFRVSTDQVARWSRAELLPRKLKQHGLGQGIGSEVRYPTHTGVQLLALCQFHREFRTLEAVGWYLWLSGFVVGSRYWRSPLISAANRFVEQRHLIKKKLLDTAGGIVSLRLAGSQLLTSLSDARIESRQFRRARRRVGRDDMGEFCRLMMTIATGAYREGLQHNDADKDAEAKILARGFGLTRAWKDKLADGTTLLSEDVEPDLERFSARIGKVSRAHLLSSITPERMARTRNELRTLLFGLKETYLSFEKQRGKHAFGLGVIADFAMITDIKLQALTVLLFEAVIRSDPQNRLKEVLQVIQTRLNESRAIDAPSSSE